MTDHIPPALRIVGQPVEVVTVPNPLGGHPFENVSIVRSVPPIDLDRMAQATRDHGMQDALDDKALQRIRERVYGKARHVQTSWFAQIAADIREFWTEVADAPAHHACFALVTFIATCVLIYGSAWVLVHTALS